ncbi:RHS repeat-associated core domain-containing protein [Streptomyces sp. NPDC102384]|uniref:RHS repeat-associated core domain-containing protein n=1 Tax=Streptomyces sp. NPDC102384 TaxID=3366166 RepID=UPI0037F362A6
MSDSTTQPASTPQSVWETQQPRKQMPPVKVGTTQAPPTLREGARTPGEQVWHQWQQQRLTGTRRATSTLDADIPSGQGAVPWHMISNVRVTDSMVVRINYSNGNLMLACTDFDIAGVGQRLQLTRTYNSFTAPHGLFGRHWWFNYEQYLEIESDKITLLDWTGARATFTEQEDGSYTAASGWRLDASHDSGCDTYVITERSNGRQHHFDSSGTLTKVRERNHGVIRVQYYPEERCGGFTLTEERSGRTIDVQMSGELEWQACDNSGRTVTYVLDGNGNLDGVLDADRGWTHFDYDSDHRITRITTPEGRVTTFTYDADNRVTSMTRATSFNGNGADGPTYTYSYSAGLKEAGTTNVTDPADHTTTYEHEADGEVTKVTDALGHERSRTYDANKNVNTATDAMGVGGNPGNVTIYGWDARSNPTSATLPTGATSSLTGYQTIAGSDLPGTLTMPDGTTNGFGYDDRGNRTEVTNGGADMGTRKFTYNDEDATCGGFQGQLCSVEDPNGHTTSFTYDDQGNLSKATPPDPRGETSYTYDELGRPITTTDGRGVTVNFTYDGHDRPVKVDSPHLTVTYVWDKDGNLAERTDPSGRATYAFDPLSRETVRTLQDGSQTVLTYTAEGNVESYEDPAGKVSYDYDEVNNLTTLTDPDNNEITFDYNANGALTKKSLPGGTIEDLTLDDSGRPTHIKATSANGTLTDLTFSYTLADGTDDVKLHSRKDAVNGWDYDYAYDSTGRLTDTHLNDSGALLRHWTFCYDAVGNITSYDNADDGTCPGQYVVTYDDADQITALSGDSSGFSYDDEGNQTSGAMSAMSTFSDAQWNDLSQMSSVTHGGTVYPAEYASTDQSERTRFGGTVFHNGPVGLSAQTAGGVDMNFTRCPEGDLHGFRTAGQTYYYLTDVLGSVEAVVDAEGNKVNQYLYELFGVPRPETTEEVTQPYRYAGGYQDHTHQYHLGARYLEPYIGRFTQPDPSGLELNPYLYAAGDPANNVDPTGLGFWSKVGNVASAAIGEISSKLQGCIGATEAAFASGIILASSAAGPEAAAGTAAVACIAGAELNYHNAWPSVGPAIGPA